MAYGYNQHPKIHDIKIREKYADNVLSGMKTYELRFNDRGYAAGDYLRFHVVDFHGKPVEHGLNDKIYWVSHILHDSEIDNALFPRWVIMSIKSIDTQSSKSPSRARWIYEGPEEWYGDVYKCPFCGGRVMGLSKYCPDCGQQILVGKEENNP